MQEQFVKMTITKPIADEMLKKNIGNRYVRRSHVEYLKRQMREGHYSFTGETIIISATDVVLDGQHRLIAVSETGIPIVALVAYGIEDSARKMIDDCIPRSQADRTSLPRPICEIIRNWNILVNGVDNRKRSAEETLEVYYSKKESFDWCGSLRVKDKSIGRAPVWVAMMCYYEIDAAMADIFANDFRKTNSEIQQSIALKMWLYRIGGVNGSSSVSEIFRKSLFCAGCHYRHKDVVAIRKVDLDNAFK